MILWPYGLQEAGQGKKAKVADAWKLAYPYICILRCLSPKSATTKDSFHKSSDVTDAGTEKVHRVFYLVVEPGISHKENHTA